MLLGYQSYSLALLLLDVVEKLAHLGGEMRDLQKRNPVLRGGHIGEAEAAGHHTLLWHRGPLLDGRGQRGIEVLEGVGLDADVVQTRPAVPQKVTIDIRAADRFDQLELHVAEVAQRNVGDEIGGAAEVAAGLRREM